VVLLEELHHPIIGVQNLFAVLGEGNLPGISQVLKRSVAPSGKVFYFLFGQEFLAGGFADKFGYKVANGTFNGFRYGRIEFASAGYVCLHDSTNCVVVGDSLKSYIAPKFSTFPLME
jgi:hypothetical protein